MSKGGKVSPTLRSTEGASHNPALFYDEQDEKGIVRRFFVKHPAGSRKERRFRSRHHPYFTKSPHKGRDWFQQREAMKLANALLNDGEERTSDDR